MWYSQSSPEYFLRYSKKELKQELKKIKKFWKKNKKAHDSYIETMDKIFNSDEDFIQKVLDLIEEKEFERKQKSMWMKRNRKLWNTK